MLIAVNSRLLISDKLDGIGWFTLEILKRICKAHPEHQFHLIFDRPFDTKYIFSENVTASVLNPPTRLPILWKYWFEIALKRRLKKIKADFFLSPEGWLPPVKNIPMLGVIHDLNFEHYPKNIIPSHRNFLLKYFPKYAARANRIATVSEYSKQDISKTYNISPSKIDVVYNGANEIFKPLPKELQIKIKNKFAEGKDYFVFIGTLHPRKNLKNLFIAFDEFKKQTNSDYKLVICGAKKWWPNELEQTFQSLESKKDIIFLGRLENQDLSTILASAFALSYLPQFEGFGIPILEAMQSGVPVVTSNTTSMPEVANGAALLADPFNTTEITNRMVELYNNPSLKEQLIHKGLLRAKDFSWQKTADLLWNSIEKTIKEWH